MKGAVDSGLDRLLTVDSLLSPEQHEAALETLNHLCSSGRACISGVAGTGKSYLLAFLLRKLSESDYSVVATAPTHKAVDVLREQLCDTSIPCRTIHSVLGLTLQPDGKGGYALEKDSAVTLPSDLVIGIDEGSMIGASLWEHAHASNARLVFAGDPAQLPPVGEPHSAVFSLPGPKLDEIVRQAKGNPIIQFANRVREDAMPANPYQYKSGCGVVSTTSEERFLESVLRSFNAVGGDKPPPIRILAYRNRRVNQLNATVRSLLYEDDIPPYRDGEWLVIGQSWPSDGAPLVQTSEEVRVVESKNTEVDGWRAISLTVRTRSSEQIDLEVLHPAAHQEYIDTLDYLRRAALSQNGSWRTYYNLRERFAVVEYVYAQTIHKAQGSTFHTVYVDVRDIARCRGAERSALMYVAATRPSDRLALLI